MFWGVKRLGDWGIDKKSWPSTVKNALFFNVSVFLLPRNKPSWLSVLKMPLLYDCFAGRLPFCHRHSSYIFDE